MGVAADGLAADAWRLGTGSLALAFAQASEDLWHVDSVFALCQDVLCCPPVVGLRKTRELEGFRPRDKITSTLLFKSNPMTFTNIDQGREESKDDIRLR